MILDWRHLNFQVSSKEAHLDGVRDELEEKQRRLDAEIEAYTRRRTLYEEKEVELDAEYDKKKTILEEEYSKKKQEMDVEYANFKKAKDNFDTELKVGLLAEVLFLSKFHQNFCNLANVFQLLIQNSTIPINTQSMLP